MLHARCRGNGGECFVGPVDAKHTADPAGGRRVSLDIDGPEPIAGDGPHGFGECGIVLNL